MARSNVAIELNSSLAEAFLKLQPSRHKGQRIENLLQMSSIQTAIMIRKLKLFKTSHIPLTPPTMTLKKSKRMVTLSI